MKLHLHWTRTHRRSGTYRHDICRCGAHRLTRYHRGRATWSSSWTPTPGAAVRAAMDE